MEAFFAEQVAEEKKSAKKSKAANPLEADKLLRTANRDFLLALDHQLRSGCGLSLRHFVVDSPLGALASGETRYKVVVTNPITGLEEPRLCIHSASGDCRFELLAKYEDGHRIAPTWHICADQGNVRWPGLAWLVHKARIRGTLTPDRLHRVTNDWKYGLSEAGLVLTCLEWQAILNIRKGP